MENEIQPSAENNDHVAIGSGSLRRMNSNSPSQKMSASVIGGAIVQILVWWNNQSGGPEIPPEMAAALTILVSFAVGYVTPPRSTEAIIEVKRA